MKALMIQKAKAILPRLYEVLKSPYHSLIKAKQCIKDHSKFNYKVIKIIFEYCEGRDKFPAIVRFLKRKTMYFQRINGTDIEELHVFLGMVLRHRKNKVKGNFYIWESNGKEMIGNLEQFLSLQDEYFKNTYSEMYNVNFKTKRVLDIGGFVGDTALFIIESGASHVTILEPLKINVEAMKFNLKPYLDKVDIHQKALNEKSGTVKLHSIFPPGHYGFGLNEINGLYEIECEAISPSELLSLNHYDIVKVDVEGAERYLLNLTDAEISKVPLWIIESHDPQVSENMDLKFTSAGFKIGFQTKLNDIITLTHFYK